MNKKVLKILADNFNFLEIGPFKTSSDTVTPFYFELRKVYSKPAIMRVLGEEIGRIAKARKVQYLVGAEMAGIPLAMAASVVSKIPFVYVKKERKKFLAQVCVEGTFRKGSQAALIDDAMYYGLTKKQLIENAQVDGLRITDIIVVYELSGTAKDSGERRWLKKNKIKVHSFFTKKQLLHYLQNKGILNKQMLKINAAYEKNPQAWHKNKKLYKEFLEWRKIFLKNFYFF